MMPRVLAALLVCAALAQTPAPLAFEAASIKPTPPDRKTGGTRSGVDSITFEGASLRYCIGFAYHVSDFQISAPAWLDEVRYDILAKGPEGAKHSELGERLQTLLAQRFKLEIHHETKEVPGFDLVVGKSGPRLTESEPKPPGPGAGIYSSLRPGSGGTLEGKNISMTMLISNLSLLLGHPIIDRTGLTGEYDFSLGFSWLDTQSGRMIRVTGPPPPEKEPEESIFQSIQKLGLRLESKKVPIDVIVVDHIERTPTAN
jgi:uncharacterized protein (TIGR03435 family)